jgi:thymidylate synthase ThyX
MKKQVLDKGFIEVVDSLGNDLTVVNSARVSFGKRKEKFDKSDERLVRYLANNGINTLLVLRLHLTRLLKTTLGMRLVVGMYQ